jgi:hypothetical protein
MNSNRTPGKLGRLAPHPEKTHPRLTLEKYVDFSALPATPKVVDRASLVPSWPMYYNDQLGDCTCAAVGHMIQGWTAYAGNEVTLPNSDILSLYEAVGGYVPGNPSTDNGCVIQDVCEYWNKTGVGGHKIAAYAAMAYPSNPRTLKQILYLFGTVYLGINCPESAQQQFQDNLPWTYDPTSPIEGGHAICLQYSASHTLDGESVVTWGALQKMNDAFVENYVEEAWICLSEDWLSVAGTDVNGFNYSQLQADFNELSNAG